MVALVFEIALDPRIHVTVVERLVIERGHERAIAEQLEQRDGIVRAHRAG